MQFKYSIVCQHMLSSSYLRGIFYEILKKFTAKLGINQHHGLLQLKTVYQTLEIHCVYWQRPCTQLFTKHAQIRSDTHTHTHTHTHTAASHVGQLIMCSISARFNCSQCCEAERLRYGARENREKEMQQRTRREINISGPWCRYIDRKLRVYCSIGANAHNYFSRHCFPEALIEKHDSESLI